jgi:hypothetical protein
MSLQQAARFRTLSVLAAALVLLCLGAGGCTSPRQETPPSDTDGPSDGDPGKGGGDPGDHDVASCASASVLVAVNTWDADNIVALSISATGVLHDAGARASLEGVQRAALRADGKEALVVTGIGPDVTKYLEVLSLGENATAVSVVGSLVLGSDNSPSDVLYTGADEAVVAMRGPVPSYLVTVRRNGSAWALGAAAPCGEGPIKLLRLPEDGHGLLLRNDFLAATTDCELLPIGRRADGAWAPEAASFVFQQSVSAIALRPDGTRAFTLLWRPSATPDAVVKPGRVLSLVPEALPSRKWGEAPGLDTPQAGSVVVASPDGRTLVVLTARSSVNEITGAEIVDRFELVTIDVAEDGTLSLSAGPRTELPLAASTVLGFSPFGHLLVDPGAKSVCPSGHGVRALARSGSEWKASGPAVCLSDALSAVMVGPCY